MVELSARDGLDALGMELHVDRIRADLTGMEVLPAPAEVDVVLPAAESAGSMTRGEGGRLVEEEEPVKRPG